MTSLIKVEKLISRMLHLADLLENNKDAAIPVQADNSFYIERTKELENLIKRYKEKANELAALEIAVTIKYNFCFRSWRNDLRTLNRYISEIQKAGTIL